MFNYLFQSTALGYGAILMTLFFVTPPTQANATLSSELREAVEHAGVPVESLNRIERFLELNRDQELLQEIYRCRDAKTRSEPSVVDFKTCDEKLRVRDTRKVKIPNARFVGIVDLALPSTTERFFFIDLETGTVEKFLTTHGRGSGSGSWAFKFSNVKNSEQSSLGLYLVGESFKGSHGEMLRLYGLERSNDQAYNRDIVIHPAPYARSDFLLKINPKTKLPYGRLGLSWGCPALSPEAFKKILPRLKQGVILDLYHADLMDEALLGREVKVAEPADGQRRDVVSENGH